MTDLAVTDALFFERTGMDPTRIEALVAESLAGMDDGELYLEYSQSEGLALDDGRIKSASFDTSQGFGLRAVRRRGGWVRACLRAFGCRDPPGGGGGAGSGERLFRGHGGLACRHEPEPLHRRQPARPGRSGGQDAAPHRDRRLCPQPRPPGQAGHGLAQWRVAGGANHSPGRSPRRRHPAAGALECRDRRRRGRPHGDRILGGRRARPL